MDSKEAIEKAQVQLSNTIEKASTLWNNIRKIDYTLRFLYDLFGDPNHCILCDNYIKPIYNFHKQCHDKPPIPSITLLLNAFDTNVHIGDYTVCLVEQGLRFKHLTDEEKQGNVYIAQPTTNTDVPTSTQKTDNLYGFFLTASDMHEDNWKEMLEKYPLVLAAIECRLDKGLKEFDLMHELCISTYKVVHDILVKYHDASSHTDANV